jgi:probable rRNA maturation factor
MTPRASLHSRDTVSDTFDVVLLGSARLGIRRGAVRRWLTTLVRTVAPSARSLGVRFCADPAMRSLNRAHRGKDQTTDVLSFPGGDTPEGYHLGDIVISVPQARRQAAAAGHSLAREIRILLLHGVLHCLGYDHETDDGAMDRLERRLRRRWLDEP